MKFLKNLNHLSIKSVSRMANREFGILNLLQTIYLLLENDYRYVNERNAETVEFFFHKNQI